MIKQVDLQAMVVSCLIVNHYRAFKYVRELRDPPPPLLQCPHFLNVKLRRK